MGKLIAFVQYRDRTFLGANAQGTRQEGSGTKGTPSLQKPLQWRKGKGRDFRLGRVNSFFSMVRKGGFVPDRRYCFRSVIHRLLLSSPIANISLFRRDKH